MTGKSRKSSPKTMLSWLAAWSLLAGVAFASDHFWGADLTRLASGWTALQMVGWVAAILAGGEALALVTHWSLVRRNHPPSEGAMLRRIYLIAALLSAVLTAMYGFGRLEAFGSFFAMFGGMLLGWSLQAPVSGFAAWLLVSAKRPFRPGDRIQFPNLGLTGDVQDIGPMYTVLDQVGGSVGSEEAVGRFILVPNAMLFSQVVINYTVTHDAPYMLDEVVVRITYDSNWEVAEKVLMDAATEVTGDIIQATGEKPYIRSDLWDYGVLMRLRFRTRVKDRTEVSYQITRKIFETIQRTPTVDLAIPFIYSARAGMDLKEDDSTRGERPRVEEVPIESVECDLSGLDAKAVEAVARSIAAQGLLQPIVLIRRPTTGRYDLLAGHVRFAACRKLGWKTVPAVVKSAQPEA